MGHTSLVGQIQMRGNVLVTGGSDGSVRVWDLEKLRCVTRMAAHDNSVTSLQFDDKIIVTGGSDGYVKVTLDFNSRLSIDLGPPYWCVYPRHDHCRRFGMARWLQRGKSCCNVKSFWPHVNGSVLL